MSSSSFNAVKSLSSQKKENSNNLCHLSARDFINLLGTFGRFNYRLYILFISYQEMLTYIYSGKNEV